MASWLYRARNVLTPTRTLLAAALLRIVLILYGEYHDRHSELKYTDVDYRVFSDATRFMIYGDKMTYGRRAVGYGTSAGIGDPYSRDTYRYTPLLAILLLPNEFVHPIWGKILFATCDLLVGLLLYRIARATTASRSSAKTEKGTISKECDGSPDCTSPVVGWVGALWLLNPMVANISTRGSAEPILGLLVVAWLDLFIQRQRLVAGVLFGLAVHFKIYPIVYVTSLLRVLAEEDRVLGRGLLGTGWLGRRQIVFGIVAFATFAGLGLTMYSIWGQSFLEHTYLYHIGRRDHRHNFSLYFYPTYLSYPSSVATTSPAPISLLSNPLVSFLPQMALALGSGLLLAKRYQDLPFVWFVQTMAFVNFNKVCTSQYFMWYMWFLPLVLPRMAMSMQMAIVVISAWISAQAVWLSLAYRLEFLGEEVYLPLWGASGLFLVLNSFVLVRLLQAYTPTV